MINEDYANAHAEVVRINQKTALVNISNIKWYEKIWKLFKDFFRK